jgi:hypothetical protein
MYVRHTFNYALSNSPFKKNLDSAYERKHYICNSESGLFHLDDDLLFHPFFSYIFRHFLCIVCLQLFQSFVSLGYLIYFELIFCTGWVISITHYLPPVGICFPHTICLMGCLTAPEALFLCRFRMWNSQMVLSHSASFREYKPVKQSKLPWLADTQGSDLILSTLAL